MYKVIVTMCLDAHNKDRDYSGKLHKDFTDADIEYAEALSDPDVYRAWIYETGKKVYVK